MEEETRTTGTERMKDTSIIGHVLEALEDFLGRPTIPADQNLRTFYSQRRYLGSRDRRAISRDYYLAIRFYRSYLSRVYPELPETEVPPAHSVARTLAPLLLEYSDYLVEDVHAGCGEDSITSLADTLHDGGADESARVARSTGFPVWLTKLAEESLQDRTHSVLDALNEEAEPELRLRPGSARVSVVMNEVVAQLVNAGARDVRVSDLIPGGLSLESRVNLSAIPVVRSGRVIVQGLGSQLIGLLLDPQRGEVIFDGCAGAGGKSIQIADMMNGDGRVIAHDISAERLGRLAQRAERLGVPALELLYPDEFDAHMSSASETFDAVLVDAPCSGTGTIRRNPGLKLTLTPDMIDEVILLQRKILDEHAQLVRPGGRLVYATCSLLKQENEDVVGDFLASHQGWSVESAESVASVAARFVTRAGYLRTDPDRDGLDGFFAARLRRSD